MHTFIQRSITLKRAIRGQWRWIKTLRSTTILPNRITPTLRQHPPLSGTPPPTFPFLNPEVVPTRPNLEESSPAGNLLRLTWPTNPRNILVVKKRRDDRVKEAAVAFAKHVNQEYSVNVIVEPGVAEEVQDQLPFAFTPPPDDVHGELHRTVDAVVTLGGDGTILHAASLFSSTYVPPILSFSLGTLGFLLPFNFKDYKLAFSELYFSNSKVLNRMRLTCQSTLPSSLALPSSTHGSLRNTLNNGNLHTEDFTASDEAGEGGGQITHAMNEVILHRGRSPHLTMLDISIDGVYLTEAIADGLILSTPTGSTAYSLSASGPLIHPSHPSILLTPICPRSLSFRPLILPPTSTVSVSVSSRARGGVELSVDGRQGRLLLPGEGVRVGSAPLGWEVPCISRPTRRKTGQKGGGGLASVSEEFIRSAVDGAGTVGIGGTGGGGTEGVGGAGVVRDEDEAAGGWVEDLNGLLGFNKGFRGRYIDHADEHEE